MVYPNSYPSPITNGTLENADWNSMVSRINGFTPSGTFITDVSFTVHTETVEGTKYYYANDAFQTVYGGPTDINGVSGLSAFAVIQTAIYQTPAYGTVAIKEGTYTAASFVQLHIDNLSPVYLVGEPGAVLQRIGIVIGSLDPEENANFWHPVLSNIHLDGIDSTAGTVGIWMSGAFHTAFYDVAVLNYETGIKLLGAMWVNDFFNIRIVYCTVGLSLMGLDLVNEAPNSIAELTFIGGHICNVFSTGQVTTVKMIGVSLGPATTIVELQDSRGYIPVNWVFQTCRFESYHLNNNQVYISEANDASHVGGRNIVFSNCCWYSTFDNYALTVDAGANIQVLNPVFGSSTETKAFTFKFGVYVYDSFITDPTSTDAATFAYVNNAEADHNNHIFGHTALLTTEFHGSVSGIEDGDWINLGVVGPNIDDDHITIVFTPYDDIIIKRLTWTGNTDVITAGQMKVGISEVGAYTFDYHVYLKP